MLLLPGSSKNQLAGLIISMNMLDTLESLQFLRTILSRAHALGGSRSASNDYIQICLEWHSIYSQFQLCQLRLNASFLQQISLSDRRNRLHGDTTQAIECLKSWRKIQN